MSFWYTVFGLRLESNQPLPGLSNLTDDLPADVQVTFEPAGAQFESIPAEGPPFYQSKYRDEGGTPLLMFWNSTTEPGYARFRYSNGLESIIDGEGARIRVGYPPSLSASDAAAYLIGPVLGYALRLRGEVVLHAGAVVVDDGVVALAGPSHSGKSTLAAAFAANGFPVFSDDVVVFREHGAAFLAQPGYPRLKLWPASAAVVPTPLEQMPRITTSEDKRFLDLTGGTYRFHDKPLPLRAIYFLTGRSNDGTPPVAIEPVGEKQGLLLATANSYMNFLLSREMRRLEFEAYTQVVRQITLRQLISPAELSALPSFCEAILADLGNAHAASGHSS